jgi:hypothetical protein
VTSNPPRTVPWKLRLRWLRERPFALLFGVMGVGLPLVIVPLQYWILSELDSQLLKDIDYDRLAQGGENASGEVIRVRIDTTETINGEHPWLVEYRFVADGREHRGRMKTLDGHLVREWQAGHPVNVRYLQTESMITDVRPHQFSLFRIWIVCACAWTVIGLACLAYAGAGMQKKARLFGHGALTTGKIIAMHLANWFGFSPLFRFRFRVIYRFQDAQGNEVLGSSISTNVALWNGGKQGDPVDVLFLKDRPEVNCLAEEHDLLTLPPSPRAPVH